MAKRKNVKKSAGPVVAKASDERLNELWQWLERSVGPENAFRLFHAGLESITVAESAKALGTHADHMTAIFNELREQELIFEEREPTITPLGKQLVAYIKELKQLKHKKWLSKNPTAKAILNLYLGKLRLTAETMATNLNIPVEEILRILVEMAARGLVANHTIEGFHSRTPYEITKKGAQEIDLPQGSDVTLTWLYDDKLARDFLNAFSMALDPDYTDDFIHYLDLPHLGPKNLEKWEEEGELLVMRGLVELVEEKGYQLTFTGHVMVQQLWAYEA